MANQNGAISRRQARAAGASDGFIRIRLQKGEWVEVASGVYASSTSAPTWDRQLWAALLGHPRAYVAGRSAAHLHRFEGVRPSRPEILVPYGGNNRSPIARIIRARHFEDVATKVVRGFVCTSVAETILTLSMKLPPSVIERYVDDQLVAKAVTIADFNPILERLEFARQPGLRALRRVIGARADDAYQPPTSELERLLYRILDREELPPYQRQVRIEYPTITAIVDAFIPDWLLIVEADGRRFHNRQVGHDKDRLRDSEALAAGLAVIRLTWPMLKYQPEDCLRRLVAIGKKRSGLAAQSLQA